MNIYILFVVVVVYAHHIMFVHLHLTNLIIFNIFHIEKTNAVLCNYFNLEKNRFDYFFHIHQLCIS